MSRRDGLSCDLEGFADAGRVLNDLPKATATASVRRSLKKVLKPVADRGAALAPRDQGNLADSYAVSTRLTKRQRRVSRKQAPVEVYAGPDDPAATHTEFGNEHQAAQPHLRPAWDSHKASILPDLAKLLWADIEKTVARHARKMAKAGRG